ncbi:MAG: ABC transporter ATP-binding protein [Asticcacaulis sp.]
MTGLLNISDLKVRYGAFEAVRGLNLSVSAGETVALVGESGCGKSTSALALMGLLPDEAEVTGQAQFEGHDLLHLPPKGLRALRGAAISMVFQDSMTSLNPVLSVGSQIVETLKLHTDLTEKAARQRAIELLELVDIPKAAQRVHEFPYQFSGGQRQRVAIAMAVACNPRLLIADEPTTALDVAIQARILELLDRLKRELNMGLLLITHDLGLVGQWADRVAIMLRGHKIEDGPTEDIFSHPQQAYTRVLLGSALSLDEGKHYRNHRLAEMPVATDDTPVQKPVTASVINSPEPALNHTPLLSLVDVHTHYAGAKGQAIAAVNGVSFDIARGETVGLVGESGCGKSTLSRTILRLLKASSGQIRFDGKDISHLSDDGLRPYRRRMQMIFQDPYASLNPRYRIGDIMQQTLKVNGVKDSVERDRRIFELIDRVRLPRESLQRFPHEFSGGQRQRVGIARALLLRPDLLICDEPASSLDLPIQAQVLNLLVELKAEFGLSYLFISHDLSVVRYMADRVLVMQGGQIVEQGDYSQIWANPTHPYTRSLIASVPGMGLRATRRHRPQPETFRAQAPL